MSKIGRLFLSKAGCKVKSKPDLLNCKIGYELLHVSGTILFPIVLTVLTRALQRRVKYITHLCPKTSLIN